MAPASASLGITVVADGSLDPRGPVAGEIADLWWVAAVGAIVFSTGRAYRRWRDDEASVHRRRSGPADQDESEHALALCGVLLGVVFLVAVLFVGVPALFLQPCWCMAANHSSPMISGQPGTCTP